MPKIVKKYFFEILISLLVVVIFITNYIPGTYLIGWDSLQTELYPWLAVKRAFFSVWQEYQSFGLPTGMAHAADLIRAIFLFLLSFILKADLIRYFVHHLMLLIGGIGAFELFKYFGFRSRKSAFAFLGSTFYILNLGTVQMFGLPFEPFSVFFAFLPWQILTFLIYIEDKDHLRKNLLSFVIINVLATPQFYQQALFLVYLMVISLLFIGIVVKGVVDRDRDKVFGYVKNALRVFVIIFIINSFWILPQLYSLRFSADITRQSKINQLATDVMVNKNIEKGRIKYLARFENFYYDLKDINEKYLFSTWKDHFDNESVFVLSYIPFMFILVGLVLGRKRYDIPLALVFGFIFFAFLSGTFPLSYLGYLLRRIFILGQVFRSPFTKFIFPYVLVCSYFFALGLDVLYRYTLEVLFRERKHLLRLSTILFVTVGFSLILFISFPVFKGNMFLPQMKLKVPNQYNELVEYFKGEEKSLRIAFLPDYTFWGWFQNNWGYDGSGFIWYGIEQPVISRTFDVWSKESESYFWEMKKAVESQKPEQFKKILDKYNVDYLVIDSTSKSITPAVLEFQYDRIYEIVNGVGEIELAKSFQDADVYKVNHNISAQNGSFISSNLLNIGNSFDLTDYDTAYLDHSTYYVDGNENFDIIYPFIDLMTQTNRFNKSWVISETEDSFVISVAINNFNPDNYNLIENSVPLKAKVFDGENINYYDLDSVVILEKERVVAKVKKVLVEDIDVENVQLVNCRNGLTDYGEDGVKDGVLKVYSRNRSAACFSYGRPFLAHWNSYFIRVDSEEVSGKPLLFYIAGNKSKAQSKIEENLPTGVKYFILGTGGQFDDGYNFGFQNVSYVGLESRNNLKDLQIYLFPFDYLKNIQLVKKDKLITETVYSNLSDLKKYNYSLYVSSKGSAFQNTFVLYQAYDDGWLALCNYKLCDAKHIKVNNWANGWVFKGGVPDNFIVIFWPQILEYVGFVLFVGLLVFSFRYKERQISKLPENPFSDDKSHSIDKS